MDALCGFGKVDIRTSNVDPAQATLSVTTMCYKRN
jgi:hypothetical protein